MSDSLRPHGLQHTRLPCPSPTPGASSNSCPLSRWCHPTISSSVVPFSSCLPSIYPSIRVFSNESALRIRWPKYWSFGFSTSPSNECPGLSSLGIGRWLGMHLLIPAQGHPVTVVCHHWALAVSNLFLRCVVIGQNGLVLPFPPFPNWKRKGPNKPEFNLFWQSPQSSYSKGGPAHRCGMILSHPGSRQRRPCFSLSVFSHVETHWPRCLPIRILMGKREKNPIFFFKERMKDYQVTPDNKTWTWLRGKKGNYFDCRTISHWYNVDTYISLLSS